MFLTLANKSINKNMKALVFKCKVLTKGMKKVLKDVICPKIQYFSLSLSVDNLTKFSILLILKKGI